jgi:hypothetical protein
MEEQPVTNQPESEMTESMIMTQPEINTDTNQEIKTETQEIKTESEQNGDSKSELPSESIEKKLNRLEKKVTLMNGSLIRYEDFIKTQLVDLIKYKNKKLKTTFSDELEIVRKSIKTEISEVTEKMEDYVLSASNEFAESFVKIEEYLSSIEKSLKKIVNSPSNDKITETKDAIRGAEKYVNEIYNSEKSSSEESSSEESSSDEDDDSDEFRKEVRDSIQTINKQNNTNKQLLDQLLKKKSTGFFSKMTCSFLFIGVGFGIIVSRYFSR